MSHNVLEEKLLAYKHQYKVLGELIEKMEAIVPFEQRCGMLLKGLDADTESQAPEAKKSVRTESAIKVKSTKLRKSVKAHTRSKIDSADKPMSLPALVQKIVTESKEPLTYSEVAEIALKQGYKSSAKNFANNVYQSLNIHVRNKVLRQEKVDGTMKFCA